MIFSCTKKVIDKVKKFKEVESEKTDIDFFNWYVDIINLERKNYFLFTNSQTLFSFFVYMGTKNELENIEKLFENRLEEQIIRNIGVLEKYQTIALGENQNYRYFKTNSRSILGSMNDFKQQIKFHLLYKGRLENIYDNINDSLNTCPMGAINYETPSDRTRKILQIKSKES